MGSTKTLDLASKTMSGSLSGKTALVTGGGRGIGKAITRSFAEAGANVAIASRKVEVLEAAARELSTLPGKVLPIGCHVGKKADLERAVAETESQLGPIDILVNNSGTNIGQGRALDATDEMLAKMVEVNVLAAFRLVNLIVPKMIDRKSGGSIINIASISGLRPQPGGLLYSFTKAGLIMMTRCWAREFGPAGIRVNAICPGLIQTDLSEYYWKDEARAQELVGDQPLRHLGQPEEIGPAARFLASAESSFVTGHLMVIDGGTTA
jgi:NAD(P)-dependent dehydrogenase (short-subunit alcohol dehydrogenase family)